MAAKEDSMESIDATSIQASIIPLNVGSEIERTLSQALTIDITKTVYEPTCDICISPYRTDVETLFKETKNYKSVIDFYAGRGSQINENVIVNHFKHHQSIERGIKELQMGEYINRLKRLDNQQLTTVDRISLSLSVLMERLMCVNGLVPSAEESEAQIEKIKCSETSRITATMASLLKLRASILGEMKNTGEVITIPAGDFVSIFSSALGEAKNNREREIINNLLTRLESLSKSMQ